MNAGLLVPFVLTALFGAGVAANEATHGWMAHMLGTGHHHMADTDGAHCWTHDDNASYWSGAAHHHGAWNGTTYGPCDADVASYHEHDHAGPSGSP